MKKIKDFKNLIAGIIAITILILVGCNKNSEPSNTPPQINSLNCTPQTTPSNRLEFGGVVNLSVVATDADGDDLYYTWTASEGSFPNGSNNNSVTWQSPTNTMNQAQYNVSVVVSDGKETDNETTTIYVDEPNVGLNVSPSTLNFGEELNEIIITIMNTGQTTLNWEIINIENWLSTNINTGIIQNIGGTTEVIVHADRESLNPGSHEEDFIVRDINNNNISQEIIATIEIPYTATVSGYIYYSDTTIPISGVTVNIDDQYDTTTSDGFFYMENIDIGPNIIKATKDGYDNFTQNINISNGNNTLNIEMTSAEYTFSLSGIVSSSFSSQPVSNVSVTILNPDGNPSNLTTITDVTGYYQIPTVPQGTRKIRFEHDNYEYIEIEIFMANNNNYFDVNMDPLTGYELSGTYNENMTLYLENSPYYIIGDTEFNEQNFLTIQSGVEITFTGDFELKGNIIAQGTEDNFIKIDKDSNIDKFDSINLLKESDINYMKVENANVGIIVNDGIENPINNLKVKNCLNGIKFRLNDDDTNNSFVFNNCEFSECQNGLNIYDVNDTNPKDFTINNCKFYNNVNNGGNGLYIELEKNHMDITININDCQITGNTNGLRETNLNELSDVNIIIDNTVIENNYDTGLYFGFWIKKIKITNSSVNNNNQEGIQLYHIKNNSNKLLKDYHIEIDNVEIKNNNWGIYERSFYVSSSSIFVLIKNSDISYNVSNNINSASNSKFEFTIENCLLNRCQNGDGIRFDRVINISNSEIKNNYGNGIQSHDGLLPRGILNAQYCEISNNKCAIYDLEEATINNCQIHDNDQGIDSFDFGDFNIYDSHIYNNVNGAIKADDCIIEDCIIENNGSYILLIDESTISNTIIRNNNGYISLRGNTNVEHCDIINNIMDHVYANDALIHLSDENYYTFYKCNIVDNQAYVFHFSAWGNLFTQPSIHQNNIYNYIKVNCSSGLINTIDLTENWWGQAPPEPNGFNSGVNYIPYLDSIVSDAGPQ